ncbi:hypothetical protein L3X38_036072 [Prunus dulcis]|uniref:Uncharacterized protein n=1 Tax=Prunus dulcis TaxID=3755 RepID=A0AAD4V0J3_PRUDU|nr:hypothetical protein L3X38_036072 [Prunus dulcis]
MTPILLQDRAEVSSSAKLAVTHGGDRIAMVGGSTMDCDGVVVRDIKVGLEAASGVHGHEAMRWSDWCGALGQGVGRQISSVGRGAVGWIAWACCRLRR